MMLHTYDGAKRVARSLQGELRCTGAKVGLAACQEAVAAAAGFGSLHDLRARIAWEGSCGWSDERAGAALARRAPRLATGQLAEALGHLRERFAHW